MSVHFLSFISCYRAAAVVCRTVDHQRVFDRFGCKCLDWISTSGLSFDAQECVDKSCFLEFMCVCVWVVGWKILGTARLLSWRPEATADL